MSINPLQPHGSTTVIPFSGAGNRTSTGTSAFDTLPSSLHRAEARSADTRQAAAELLRIEMMHNALSLSGEGEICRTSGIQALDSLLSGLAGGRHAGLAGTGRRVHTGEQGAALVSQVTEGDFPGKGTGMDEIGKTAAQLIGTPYRFGGEGPAGIDCSSFVQQVFQEHQIELPRTAREQMKMGAEVADGDLRKGDLVFFQTYASYPSHVGIYLGEGKMIHASSGKGEVTVSDMDSDYYRSRYLGAKRVA